MIEIIVLLESKKFQRYFIVKESEVKDNLGCLKYIHLLMITSKIEVQAGCS